MVDSVKCNLNSVFEAIDEVLCDDLDCRRILSPPPPIAENPTPVPDSPKRYADASIQVKSGDLYETFGSRIKTDRDLAVLCGIRNHKILEKLVFLLTKIYPEKRKHKMTFRDRLIMTTMKLKHDLTISVLTIIFHPLAESTCRLIFLDTLQKLAKVLKGAIHWAPKEEITRNMPHCFEKFQNTICVVDCTEFKIQTPKCLACRLKIYSQYKSGFTVKFMTAVSPAGLLMYVSEAYGGRCHDSTIFEDSNIVKHLDPGDAVMADKGFRIEGVCDKHGIKLHRPAFLEKKKQFSEEEAVLNRYIAAARVHVERVNQRIEIFDIVKNKLSWNLVPHVNDIMIVCCGLANLGTPILDDDKFM